ncbi:N-methylglutamate dehydrogenase subunit C [Stella humosa]|uniref:N-methylglutamate dehydrogenase subunit C n=1 Tax=Stella humosa TaxID=94 RepID=A0A3N1L1P6_9PROT|nr:sarcosine oxidase subunit alpha family protein [Stella humosa]ROP84508.1 N-methylglutamate dehydrogenase subunit C [Stella humosa]BBK34028.1 sarcosine oxidase subunit alpha [Stella humosa]
MTALPRRQPMRTRSGGHIDRDQRLTFRFDGREYGGYAGDTLASALLANGVRIVGRSFKYHRPRGIYGAGPEEPNALAEIGTGARRTPNSKMTGVELHDGLVAASQNRWPSLGLDLLSINSALARLLPAGFYYKTFMWPAAFWEKVYEPAIRRAAGLGRATTLPDPDHYEAAHAHCDVLVVGAGAAGLAAARAAGEAGARVILAEQDFLLGGGLLAERPLEPWRREMLAALAALKTVTVMPRTTVFGYYEQNMLGALERVSDHLAEPAAHAPRQRYWTIRAREVVLATGADERLIAFPGNDRPGVMLAGAVRTYAERFGVLAGRRAVLFTNNDAAYATADALVAAGADQVTVLDARPLGPAAAAARQRGIPVMAGHEITGAHGGRGLYSVEARAAGTYGSFQIDADLLCVSGGYGPAIHLASQSRTAMRWDERIAAFVPGEAAGQRSAGAARGRFGIGAAASDGLAAGQAAAAAAGFARKTAFDLPSETGDPDPTVTPFWEVAASGKSFVDLQHDVTTADIRLAHREGYTHIEHAKRYTTHAMATDQGKTGGLVGAAVLAEARGLPVEAVGMPTYRPYVSPITWGAVAGHHTGRDFAPIRRTMLHDWHARRGAEFMEAGLWLRPAFYPRPGEAVWDAIVREGRAVRTAVGICDVSTLGKIDLQGADAGLFLDRLYMNTFSTLPVGKARYGLMLREDGLVLDDGTTSRLAPDHFFVTTTTANAGRVMEHMEFHAQTVWPELDVQFASVTDHWASMSVAGPQARRTLAKVVEGLDLADAALPFMGVADATLAGCPIRIFRISFSGELAFEVATPAGYALPVWEAILAAGAEFGIEPYGVEALGLLRIEKGHVAGAELNGQTTARDVGLERMAKKRGDFVGRVLAERPGLADPSRPRLVGVRPVVPEQQIRAGAHLVEAGSQHSLGWISSITRSVEPGGWVGLALLTDGAARHGQRLHAAFPLYGESVEVEITSPHFVDPENARVRA